MGNNNSHSSLPQTTEVVRRPPNRPNVPPSARPISELGPKGPSYHSPENQVLPREIPSILKLRPVSMELSKYNPEFSDIFAHETKENLDSNENKIETNEETELPSSPRKPPAPVQNGFGPASPPQVPNGHLPSSNNVVSPSNTKSNGPYRPSHRRQMSLGQEPTILEEPEESIDSRVKLDPLMQSFPGATGPSLPVKNNFNLDYSYQLTYVQLAEHRRNKTIEELEKRTGKSLSELSADLNEHVDKPSFVRGASSRVSSRSEGSAISSKKKKAPPPPGQAPPPPPINSPSTSEQYSIHNEPPIDYDLESPRRPPPPKFNSNTGAMLPRYKANPSPNRVVRENSNRAPHAPPPPPVGGFKKSVNLSRASSMSDETPKIILKKTPEIKTAAPESDGKIPWLLEIKNLSEARAARRQLSQEAETPEQPASETEKPTNDNNALENHADAEKLEEVKPKLVFESSTDSFKAEKPMAEAEQVQTKSSIERSNSVKETAKPPSPKLQRHHSTTGHDHPVSAVMQRQVSEPAKLSPSLDPVRRLSSLLQHDIKAAANAKCLKLVKQTTPVPPKPKDPHTIFREQLQKACAARDERAKTEGTIDEKLQRNSSFDQESTEGDKNAGSGTPRKDTPEAPETLPKPPRYHKNVQMNRHSSIHSKIQNGHAHSEEKQRSLVRQKQISMSLDWTPEDDLESDDNLSDREVLSNRQGAYDGFKSTIVPNTMIEMKGKKKAKSKKQKDIGSSVELSSSKNKFGSVKKLKKSMHKGVKNAFGSISKASGKILRKQRSEEFEQVDDAPKNWSLNPSTSGSSNRSPRYEIPLSYRQDDDGSDSDTGKYIHENEFSEVIFRQNVRSHSDSSDSTYESEDKAPQNIRRAGVAYISSKGQLVLMKDEDEEEEVENMKMREKKKKKKDKSSTLERAAEDLREKERRLEEERRKQLEMELELHKRREAETRERLQRLETAHLQQQLTAAQLLQQQQQQNHVGTLTAPPMPHSASFPTYGTLPDSTHTQTGFTSLFGQQLAQNGFQPNFGVYAQTNPYMNGPISSMPMDINDYMRRLGVQTPPTSQQMAFFLNSMSLAGQPFERKSNPVMFDMFNQQYPTGALNFQGMDPSMKKSGFQNWASTPNVSAGASVGDNVPLSDFVASYNGANSSSKDSKGENVPKSRNPVYNSDSDEGLSPQKSVVRAQVKDHRQLPVRTESGKFMRRYGSENFVPIKSSNGDTTNTDGHLDNNKSLNDITITNSYNQQRSVSPSNSVSTVDSAMSSPSVSLSTPSSPTRSADVPPSPLATRSQKTGFKTVLDLNTPEGGAMQIISTNRDQFNT